MNWLKRFFGVGSKAHWQTYYGLRQYPIAFGYTALVAFELGFLAATLLWRYFK